MRLKRANRLHFGFVRWCRCGSAISSIISGCATSNSYSSSSTTQTSWKQSAAAPASGQLFWDWDGDHRVGGSGRRIVRFAPSFEAGEIVVSFADRRLYLVTKRGEAMSYPIAVPREQDRWEGVTKVSDKKINPSWTPTPTMVAENPMLPRWVPGGHSMNPSACGRCTSPTACTASTEPMPLGRSARRSRRDAFECIMTTFSISIRGSMSASK